DGFFSNPIDGAFSVEYRDTDGNSASDSLFLVYTPTNDPPVAADDTYSGTEDLALTVPSGVLLNDSDPNLDSLAVTKVNNTAIGSPIAVAGGTVVMAADGSFTFTPTPNVVGDS